MCTYYCCVFAIAECPSVSSVPAFYLESLILIQVWPPRLSLGCRLLGIPFSILRSRTLRVLKSKMSLFAQCAAGSCVSYFVTVCLWVGEVHPGSFTELGREGHAVVFLVIVVLCPVALQVPLLLPLFLCFIDFVCLHDMFSFFFVYLPGELSLYREADIEYLRVTTPGFKLTMT